MALCPIGRAVVLAVAIPPLSALVANGVPLARKTTFPVGRANGGTPVTVAVNVTLANSTEGLVLETRPTELLDPVMTPVWSGA